MSLYNLIIITDNIIKQLTEKQQMKRELQL